MSDYLGIFFRKFQCGFRQGISTQHCLLVMIEKWKKFVDKGKTFGALLTDLSKAFDCLPHDLIIAKLNAYGFSLSASELMHNYLSHRKQRTKINSSYSSWEEILFGVPQGSILGPLLFNIFVSDLFSVLNDVEFASYADDNTPYVVKNNIKSVIKSLENTSVELFDWFPDNQMKANPDKYHFITSESKDLVINAENNQIANSKCEKLLGIKIDHKLTFNAHIDEICKEAGQKMNALSRIIPYLNITKRSLLNTFFMSQFNYRPLTWMCLNRAKNNKINRLYERRLRIICEDKGSTLAQLLEKDSSVSIHTRNLRFLAVEMFKVNKGLAPTIVNDLFPLKEMNNYNLRHKLFFKIPRNETVRNGFESISYLGPKIWEMLPSEMQECDTFFEFKSEILESYKLSL